MPIIVLNGVIYIISNLIIGTIGYIEYNYYTEKIDAFKVLLSDNKDRFQKCYSSDIGFKPLE